MSLVVRPWSPEHDSLAELTELLHAAYAELAALGLRYVATHQDEATTRARLERGEAFVAEWDGRLAGTITLVPPGRAEGCAWYRRAEVAVFSQFGVAPDLQRRGIGRALLDRVDARARELGALELACDTSESATHLIALYERLGFRIVDEANWDCVNYRSVILSRTLS